MANLLAKALDGEEGIHLGAVRPSMIQNELLLKAPMGTAKRRGHPLPQEPFIYGRPYPDDDGGVAECMHKWNVVRREDITARLQAVAEKDFMALNKAAVNRGIVNAKDQFQFRAKHDIRRKVKSEDDVRTSNKPNAATVTKDDTFGQTARPSTPMWDLLEHKFSKTWKEEVKARELMRKEMQQSVRQKIAPKKGYYETHATKLRTFVEPVDPGPMWQMKKFSHVPAALETFRNAKDKEASFKHTHSDKIGRQGTIGAGIYTSALS